MKSSKLVQIFKSFNKHELNKLEEMVNSPFFNKDENVTTLFSLLKSYHPDLNRLEKDKVKNKLFPKSKDPDKDIRYAMSNLSQIAEQFLAYREFDENEVQKSHLLLKAFHKKNLLQFAQSQIDKGRQVLNKSKLKDDNFYFENFLIEKDNYEYIASKRNLAVRENLTDIIQNLDYFYIIYKLKISAELINHTEAWAGKYDPLMIDEIMSHIKAQDNAQVPALNIYYEIMKMLTDVPSEPHYYRLKELLDKHSDKFPRAEVNDMYIFARNYCAKKINSGDTDYLKEIFDLYKSLLEKEILLVNGYLSQWDYKNIVAVGLRIEAFDWVKSFIYDFKEKIRPEDRENAFTYNLANYYYYRGQPEETMHLLHNVEFTDVYYNLDCKILLLKSYFELEEIDPLFSLMDSFYMYLRRNKLISDFQRNSYMNFLKMLRKINRVKPGNEKRKESLLDEIEKTDPLANVSWLKKKVEDIG